MMVVVRTAADYWQYIAVDAVSLILQSLIIDAMFIEGENLFIVCICICIVGISVMPFDILYFSNLSSSCRFIATDDLRNRLYAS